jgi:mannose-1-phosphate guanylyltransferase
MTREPWVLVLSGGDGTRLQALTQEITGAPIPKQYCPLVDGRSLLEATLARARAVTRPDRILVVVNRAHLPVAAAQLARVPAENVLVQPRNCDTGPGLAFSLGHLARRDPTAECVVFPSDHWISDEAVFAAHVRQVLCVIHRLPGKLALLGIQPEHAEPGFGYIEPASPVPVAGVVGARRVAAFREKPTAEEAERLVAAGGLWNSFVMAFHVPTVLRLLAHLRPADIRPMQSVAERPDLTDALYQHAVEAWNFSSGFLARIPQHLVVVRTAGTGWSDWGTPEAIARTFALLRRVPPWREPAARAAVA